MPIAKALEEHTLLVFGMNGEPLPFIHGGPLRLVVPGWPGSLSQKWLTRIWIRDREHDGPGMTGKSYRMPVRPLPPGADADGNALRVLESMPVRSIVRPPPTGPVCRGHAGDRVRGAAWAGDDEVARVDVTIDGGATWIEATLSPPAIATIGSGGPSSLNLPDDGYYEFSPGRRIRAGSAQPFRAANWNPKGYGCNVMHKMAITVGPEV